MRTRIEVRNKIFRDEPIDVLRPAGPVIKDRILDILDANHQSIAWAQPGAKVILKLKHEYLPNDLIRRTAN